MKKCCTCKKEKKEIDFHKNSSNKDGLQCACKECNKLYIEANKEKVSLYGKHYRLENKDKSLDYNNLYREQNKVQISKQRKEYRQINKIEISNKKRIYERNKSHNDPAFKLRKKISLFVRLAIANSKSGYSILEYLPYSMEELKQHLESQFESWMTWKNWGSYDSNTWSDDEQFTWTWQLDHIIPQAHLPYNTMDDENFKKCWALNNLRPLSAKQNILLGSKVRSL